MGEVARQRATSAKPTYGPPAFSWFNFWIVLSVIRSRSAGSSRHDPTRRVAQKQWKAIVRALQWSIPTATLDGQIRAARLHLICLCAVTLQREEFHEQLPH